MCFGDYCSILVSDEVELGVVCVVCSDIADLSDDVDIIGFGGVVAVHTDEFGCLKHIYLSNQRVHLALCLR